MGAVPVWRCGSQLSSENNTRNLGVVEESWVMESSRIQGRSFSVSMYTVFEICADECYMPVFTNPVTLSSISLSVKPVKDKLRSGKIAWDRGRITRQWLLLLLPKLCVHDQLHASIGLVAKSIPYLA